MDIIDKFLCDRLIRNDETLVQVCIRGISQISLDRLCRTMRQSSNSVKALSFPYMHQVSDLAPLADYLASPDCTLVRLHISRTPADFCVLACSLRINTSLQDISITNCNLDNDIVTAFCEALMVNKTLKDIGLQNCGIGNYGARAFATMLSHNESLRYVNLISLNNKTAITDEGAHTLCRVLEEHNVSLTTLSISDAAACPPRIKELLLYNKFGRKLLKHHNVPLGLWPLVFTRRPRLAWWHHPGEEVSSSSTRIYYFLQMKAGELIASSRNRDNNSCSDSKQISSACA
jgi:hypothetical protein